MASSTVILVTGAGRGIAKAVTTAYLSRPNHIVIGTLRNVKGPQAQELQNLPVADDSRLLLVSIENSSFTDPKKAVGDIEAAGIDHIDVVVASAGISPPHAPLDAVDPKILLDALNINAVATVTLFQAVNKLLDKSSAPKWITLSSRVGSIGQAEAWYYYVGPYGLSKAAQNWFTRTLHEANTKITALAVHPGFVSTDMGVAAATGAGIDMPPTSPEESATKLLETIDKAIRETVSGKFLDTMTGEIFLW